MLLISNWFTQRILTENFRILRHWISISNAKCKCINIFLIFFLLTYSSLAENTGNNNSNHNSLAKKANQNPNINFIKVSPRVSSIAAFSTRNLFRNFETLSPSDKADEQKKSNLLTPCDPAQPARSLHHQDSLKIQDFKAKIYDNLMKSTANMLSQSPGAASVASVIKNEFKPHILHLSMQQKELRDKLKVSQNAQSSWSHMTSEKGDNHSKADLSAKIANNSSKVLNKALNSAEESDHVKPPLTTTINENFASVVPDTNILNSKSTGQIPSKYSSFTDYNKNKMVYVKHDRLKIANTNSNTTATTKSSTKLNEKLEESFGAKMTLSDQISGVKQAILEPPVTDWAMINQNVEYFDDMFDYNPFNMQAYEYNPSFLNFNYFNDANAALTTTTTTTNANITSVTNTSTHANSTGTTTESNSTNNIEKVSNTSSGFQVDKSQRLNDYLVEMTNYYRNFNANYNTAQSNANLVNIS